MMAIDSAGVYGAYLHYGLTILMVGSAMIVFAYLWYKDRLDMDEEPKLNMMRIEEEKDGR